jgi:thiol-disulfide isomerase/thioredoxin
LAARFTRPSGPIALAVFVSPGCALCAELEPAIAALGRELPVEVFDEERDALAWEISRVPGSPYAVALDNGGVVLARGTFNTPAQLRSIPATALYRLGGELVRG